MTDPLQDMFKQAAHHESAPAPFAMIVARAQARRRRLVAGVAGGAALVLVGAGLTTVMTGQEQAAPPERLLVATPTSTLMPSASAGPSAPVTVPPEPRPSATPSRSPLPSAEATPPASPEPSISSTTTPAQPLPTAGPQGAVWSQTVNQVSASMMAAEQQVRVGETAEVTVVVTNNSPEPVRLLTPGCGRIAEILVELDREPVRVVQVDGQPVPVSDQTRLDVASERFGVLRSGCRTTPVSLAAGERYSGRQTWRVRSVNDTPFSGTAVIKTILAVDPGAQRLFDLPLAGQLRISGGDPSRLDVPDAVRAALADERVQSMRTQADPDLSPADRRPGINYSNGTYKVGFTLRRSDNTVASFSVRVDGRTGRVSAPETETGYSIS